MTRVLTCIREPCAYGQDPNITPFGRHQSVIGLGSRRGLQSFRFELSKQTSIFGSEARVLW